MTLFYVIGSTGVIRVILQKRHRLLSGEFFMAARKIGYNGFSIMINEWKNIFFNITNVTQKCLTLLN